jgi:prephenate dehydrogenase
VIATQMQETEAVYEMIGADLRSGAVVLDFSPLKRPALQWAAKHVGAEVYVIGVTPAINPKYLFDAVDDTDHAHDDLFEKGSLLLAPAPNCIKEAVELAMDFAALLDASFTFTDPVELDGLTAAMESVPAVLGVMAYHALSRTDGWQDGQRVTNSAFGALTHHLFDTHPDHLRDTLMHNRESVLRYLDVVIEGLGDFRRELARGDHDAVEAALVEAAQTYEVWYNRRLKGDWQGKQQNPMEGVSAMGQMVSGLFGSYLTGRLKGGKDKR